MKIVLTYHSIDESGSVVSASRTAFTRQMEWLARGGVKVVPLSAIASCTGAGDAVALTFDDGYRNFAETALPVLLHHGLPATVFIVSRRVAGENDWDREAVEIPKLPLMSWDELGRCVELGVDLGGHSRTHHALTGMESHELQDEIEGCAEDITRGVGLRPRTFAYPYGLWDDASRDAVSRSFDVACTTDLRPLARSDHSAAIPRIDSRYLTGVGRIEAFGQLRFAAYIRIRRAVRNFRIESIGRLRPSPAVRKPAG
jgi:peptidoglycan/xylan/chitin deacetylase (PgdA/CDA1 family)